MTADQGPILTLEPFIEAIRQGVEASGWALSGLQKTTSHEFAGRWEGESSRSAYLFFHRTEGEDEIGIEAFLDETTRGVQGNLSLVVEGPPLGRLGDVPAALGAASEAARRRVPRAHHAAVSLKLRVEDGAGGVGGASTELRVKVRVPQSALHDGVAAVGALAARVVRAYEALLDDPGVALYRESQ
jgi:hypothetical protein